LVVEGDPDLLGVAVGNLLQNAWKYTRKTEETEIAVGMKASTDGTIYYVEDNGVGFAQEGADRIFQPFQRLHSQQDFPGTGVGLATVRRIINSHGGRVWAESTPGKGATFYFTLP
jgi:signal transduction histidine kinase